MKRPFYITLVYCFILLSVHSQHIFAQEKLVIDSLINLLEKTDQDTSKINLLLELFKEYLNNDIEKAESYAKQALNHAEKADFDKGIATAYKYTGLVHLYKGNYTQAIHYYHKSLEIARQMNDSILVMHCINNIGVVYDNQGDFTHALDYYRRAMTIAEKLSDEFIIATCLNNIGNIYSIQGNFAEALTNYKKSVQLSEKLDDKNSLSDQLMNIGSVYYDQGNYDEAISYYERALTIAEEMPDNSTISACLNNIGNIHSAQGNSAKSIEYYSKGLSLVEKRGFKNDIPLYLNNIGQEYLNQKQYLNASEYLNKALAISTEIGDKTNIAISVYLLGVLNLEQGDYQEAMEKFEEALKLNSELDYKDKVANNFIKIGLAHYKLADYTNAIRNGLKGLEIAREIRSKDNIRLASELLAQSYASLNNFEQAYHFQVLFKEMHDSIFTIESKKKIAAVESRYAVEKKEQEIKLQKAEIERNNAELLQQKNKQKTLIGGFGVILLVLVLLVFLIRLSQQKKAHKLKAALYMNMQQTLSQQMNPHFISNILNSIQNYIIKNRVEDSLVYIAKFAELMRRMLYHAQNYLVALKDELDTLRTYTELEALRLNNQFSFHIELDESINASAIKVPVFLLQPLVENAIKHGLEPLKGKGAIYLKIEKVEDGIKCRIEDNGVGQNHHQSLEENGGHQSMAGNLIRKRLNILSLYYNKRFMHSLKNLTSESGDVIGSVSEITIPIVS